MSDLLRQLNAIPAPIYVLITTVVMFALNRLTSRQERRANTALTQANLLEKLENITTEQGGKLVEQAATIAELKRRLAMIEGTLLRTQTEKDALAGENQKLLGRIAHLEDDRAADKATVVQLTADLQSAKQKNRELQAEIEVLRADVGALRARVAKQDVVLIEQHIIPVADDIKPQMWPESNDPCDDDAPPAAQGP